MPKNAAANGAKNSTSVAPEFIVRPYYPDAITTLQRALWRIAYRTRRAILRKISTDTYAIERRQEMARCKAQLLPLFQLSNPSNK